MDCSTPDFPVYHPEFTQTHVHRVSDGIQSSHPLSSPSPPAFNISQPQSFFKESILHIRWPKYWNFSISSLNEYSGLTSIRIDWLDLLTVQKTRKSLLQPYFLKASLLRHSAFFMVQHSYPCMTTDKSIALTRQTFVGILMSLVFNMLSRLVMAFLPRSKYLLISWLQSPSAVTLEPKKIKSVTVSPSACYEVMGPDAMILVYWMLSFKPAFSLSSFTFIKRIFSPSSLSAIRVIDLQRREIQSSAYLRLLIFLPEILIAAYASATLAFCMMYSA